MPRLATIEEIAAEPGIAAEQGRTVAQLRVKLALLYARALERRNELERVLSMLGTLLELGLGSPRWREQAEARVRRLEKKRWRKQLAPAT